MASASSSATSTPIVQPTKSPQITSGSAKNSPLASTATTSSKVAMETLTLQPTNLAAVLAENEKLKAEIITLKHKLDVSKTS